jgi:hypothetical protein
MKKSPLGIALASLAALLFAACPAPEEEPFLDPDAPRDPVVEPTVGLPDTTGAGLWSYLHEANYREWRGGSRCARNAIWPPNEATC